MGVAENQPDILLRQDFAALAYRRCADWVEALSVKYLRDPLQIF
jgi:hypothetical protein